MRKKKVMYIIACIVIMILIIGGRRIYRWFVYNPNNYDDYYEAELALTKISEEEREQCEADYIWKNIDDMLDNMEWENEEEREAARQKFLELYEMEE